MPLFAPPQGAPASSAMCENVREIVLPGGAVIVLWQSRLSPLRAVDVLAAQQRSILGRE